MAVRRSPRVLMNCGANHGHIYGVDSGFTYTSVLFLYYMYPPAVRKGIACLVPVGVKRALTVHTVCLEYPPRIPQYRTYAGQERVKQRVKLSESLVSLVRHSSFSSSAIPAELLRWGTPQDRLSNGR